MIFLPLRLQFILQWLTGILVLICCFVKRKQFSVDISSKLGTSFSMVPFVIVVVSILLPLLLMHVHILFDNYISLIMATFLLF